MNSAEGLYSLAAGRQAKAMHDGSFVWADSTAADFSSVQDNEFAIRASGGVRIQGTAKVMPGGDISMGSFRVGTAP